jgi:hypothetical protein
MAGADDAASDLTAIGNQYTLEHAGSLPLQSS